MAFAFCWQILGFQVGVTKIPTEFHFHTTFEFEFKFDCVSTISNKTSAKKPSEIGSRLRKLTAQT